MGGLFVPNTVISGGVSNPGIPFVDSPASGLYETISGGLGIALAGGAYFELNPKSCTLGFKPSEPFSLSPVAGSPVAVGNTPWEVAFSPDGAHVLVTNYIDNTVSVFAINSITGALTAVAGSPFATGLNPLGIAVSPDGVHVVVINNGANTISVFSRNATTGALTAVAGSPFAAGAIPYQVAISSDGKHVLVPNYQDGTVSVFSLNATTGALTAVAGSPFATGINPEYIAMSSNGLYVFVANNGDNTISVFSRNATTGALTAVVGSPFASPNTPGGIAVTPDGKHVIIANETGNSVGVFSLNATTGALTQVAGSPFAVGVAPQYVAISPDSANVLVVNNGSNTVNAFSLNATTGALTAVAGSPFAVGVAPEGIAFSPDGVHVVVVNQTGNSLTVFQTAVIETYNLFTALFDSTGSLGGSIDIKGLLRLQGLTVLSQAQADLRYAALAGLITQAFSAKTLTLDHAAGGLEGTTTNDNAIAGVVGEYIADVVATPGVALATAVVSNVGSIALTPGDWDVDGVVDFVPAATTSISQLTGGLSTATGVLGGQDTFAQDSMAAEVPGANNIVMRTPTVRISINAATTVYLVASGVFTVSTLSAFGTIRARRVR